MCLHKFYLDTYHVFITQAIDAMSNQRESSRTPERSDNQSQAGERTSGSSDKPGTFML